MNAQFHFLIFVWGDVEPECLGPFPTEAARDTAALQFRAEHGPEHGYLRAMVTVGTDEPKLEVHAYESDFFERIDNAS